MQSHHRSKEAEKYSSLELQQYDLEVLKSTPSSRLQGHQPSSPGATKHESETGVLDPKSLPLYPHTSHDLSLLLNGATAKQVAPAYQVQDLSPGLPPIVIPQNSVKVPVDERPLLPRDSLYSDAGNEGRLESKEDKYDRTDIAGASVGSAVFNLTTTIIGAGIMALPATMRVLGVPIGLLLILIMGVLSELSLEIVVHFLALMKVWSYGDMVGGACGWAGRVVAQLCIIINNAGILIVYLIILGDVLSGSPNHPGLFEEWAGGAGWWTNRKLVLLITMVIVLMPLALLKRIDSLKFSSAVSVVLALVFVFLASAIAFVKLVEGKIPMPRMLPSFGSKRSILELLTVIPIMTNAYVCNFNVPPIYLELRERTPAKMYRVGRITIALCVLVYMATALSGYLLFGDATAADVLSNFDTNLGIPFSNILDDVIRIGYALHLMLVFPIIHFSLRQTVDAILFPSVPPLSESRLRFALLTFVLLTSIFVGSTVVPNIWIAFQFTGATTGLSLGFIFPALLVIRSKSEGRKLDRENRPLAWTMLIMAGIVSGLGVGTQIYNVVTGEIS